MRSMIFVLTLLAVCPPACGSFFSINHKVHVDASALDVLREKLAERVPGILVRFDSLTNQIKSSTDITMEELAQWRAKVDALLVEFNAGNLATITQLEKSVLLISDSVLSPMADKAFLTALFLGGVVFATALVLKGGAGIGQGVAFFVTVMLVLVLWLGLAVPFLEAARREWISNAFEVHTLVERAKVMDAAARARADAFENAMRSRQGYIFTRWGHVDCPSSSEEVYRGYAGSSHKSNSGGAANVLCLTSNPINSGEYSNVAESNNRVYGVLYGEPSYFKSLQLEHLGDHTVVCTVCEAKAATFMLPGSDVCPEGWGAEYTGYLMGPHHAHHRGETVCVDKVPVTPRHKPVQGSGGLWYPAEVRCGGVLCAPYTDNHQLACSQCTRTNNTRGSQPRHPAPSQTMLQLGA